MKILRAFPPNFKDIVRVFPQARGRGVMFAYGDTIYNPSGGIVSPSLIAHEQVHGDRQLGLSIPAGPQWWWNTYLTDPTFRLSEELLAHRAEYHSLGHSADMIAHRLSGKLYRNMISYDDALKAITA